MIAQCCTFEILRRKESLESTFETKKSDVTPRHTGQTSMLGLVLFAFKFIYENLETSDARKIRRIGLFVIKGF